MILIITHKSDFTADYVIDKLNRRSIAYKRLNCEDILKYSYHLSVDENFKASFFGQISFDSVWFRRTKLPVVSGLDPSSTRYILGEIDALFENLYELWDAKWLSVPREIYRAENKLLQLKIAKEIGFNIPRTLVTSSKKDVLEFYVECNRNMIVKPLSSTRIETDSSPDFIFTTIVTDKSIQDIGNADLTPCIFQENIAKDIEIRVTVVGNSVFSASIDSQSDEMTKQDWRRKQIPFHKHDLPDSVSKLCIELLRRLNINFGAIDLIKTNEGQYVFLEINPNGQWVWIENQTGLAISDSIINYLSN